MTFHTINILFRNHLFRIPALILRFFYAICACLISGFSCEAHKYSAVILDPCSGKMVYGICTKKMRRPASLTKMMTLYLLFDALERGKVSLSTRLFVSRKASLQSPTKIGLRHGGGISVKECILAMSVLSANDAAMVVAENVGGSEERFVSRMNKRANSIGMKNTVFYNPTGLPDMRQVTTARDMAVLTRSLWHRFPKYCAYMRVKSIKVNNHLISSTNRLLGKVDGLLMGKTGYTCASGFNLATLTSRNGKPVIVVVMGGDSHAERDCHVKNIINTFYSNPRRIPSILSCMERIKSSVRCVKKSTKNNLKPKLRYVSNKFNKLGKLGKFKRRKRKIRV